MLLSTKTKLKDQNNSVFEMFIENQKHGQITTSSLSVFLYIASSPIQSLNNLNHHRTYRFQLLFV